MKRVVINLRWEGPETKRLARLKATTTARLCKELGRPKPILKLPKENRHG